MKAASLSILLCTVVLAGSEAAPLKLAPGTWEFTDLIRNFYLNPDGRYEVTSGGSGPNTQRACMTEDALEDGSLYRGLKPALANHCKKTTISETSDLVDYVIECSAYEGAPRYVAHSLITASTPQSFTTITETTFLEPHDGRISRSTMSRRGRWLKSSCEK